MNYSRLPKFQHKTPVLSIAGIPSLAKQLGIQTKQSLKQKFAAVLDVLRSNLEFSPAHRIIETVDPSTLKPVTGLYVAEPKGTSDEPAADDRQEQQTERPTAAGLLLRLASLAK